MAIDEKIRGLLIKARNKEGCKKHSMAAVIEIETSDKKYILGWNGAPLGIKHDKCLREGYPSGEGTHLCPGVHAERRAIYHAIGHGVPLRGGTIYMSEWFPCADCAKSIIEAGLARLVTPDELYADKEKRILIPKLQNQSYNFEMAERLLREAGIEVVVNPSIKP